MNTIKILTIESEEDSALRLDFPTYTYLEGYAPKFSNEVIVRWGNSTLLYDKDCDNSKTVEFDNVINPSSAIRLNCYKAEALNKLATVVNTPERFDVEVPKNMLVVYRPTTHSGGYGFSVRKGPFKIEYGYYATKFLKTNTEYRVWFAGKNTMAGKRVTKQEIPEHPCRSSWGYQFCKMPINLHQETLAAAKAIGLEVGAADVLSVNGKHYFLELNSAPTIDMMKIEAFYREHLVALVKNKFPKFKF